ncbi:MAG TPA: hypothetical protein VH988_22925 [Thermoanaerobaculia bacterium]|jgi:hypothetical protein|nr:hypothetical protein [Thermoanaerobaculia bacterium]
MRVPEIYNIEVQCWVFEGGTPSNWQFSFENSAFILELKNGQANFRFKYPLTSMKEAEDRVAEFLKSWEGDILLQTGPIRRHFEIRGYRAPGHGGMVWVHGSLSVAGDLAEANTRQQTPWRRHPYWKEPLVAALVRRYEDYRCGRERLSVLGFLCLSALQHAFGGRKALAGKLKIELAVLNELGRLVSTVGSYGSARKINPGHDLRDFSPEEEYWIESVTRHLIVRAGDLFKGRALVSILTMQDLPQL